MKKNLIAMGTAAVLSVSMGAAALAANDDVTVIVNGETIDFTGEQAPVIVGERTLVPFRAVFEKMGAEVNWYEESRTCEATYGSITVTLEVGESVMYIGDGTTVDIDVPAQIINNRTMVPVRAISEGIGAIVGWDDKTRTVTVESPEITESFPSEVNTLISSKGYTSETTGVTVTFDFPVVTDEFTASAKLNDSISDDIISVAQQAADKYTGDLKEANISCNIRNSEGLLEVSYVINNQELIYTATYSIATGSKIDENYLSEIYGDGKGYKILTYSPETIGSHGHEIKAYAEYPQFDENSEIISSLNAQLENSAKKAVDEYLASYREEAETNDENQFAAYCSVEIGEDNIATVITEYLELTNGQTTNKSEDVITVNLKTGEVIDKTATGEDK
jgi:hypothetical protein